MSVTLLYFLFVILPNLCSAFAGAQIITVLFLITYLFCCVVTEGDAWGWNKRNVFFKWLLGVFIVVSALAVFVPSQSQIFTIAGGYVVTNDKQIAALPDNMAKAANAYLGKLAGLAQKPEKEKKGK